MDEKEHFDRLISYYEKSRLGYDLALQGSKHFGFYPEGGKVTEKKAQSLLQELVAKKLRVSPKDVILDAGCGQGVVSTYLAQKYGCRIEGITVVPFETNKASLLAKKLGVAGSVSYSLMDYNKTRFHDCHFDGIYTTETLCHSVDIRKTLREFYRILKKGGSIALFEYTLAEDAEFSGYEKEMIRRVAKGSAMDGLKDFRHNKFQGIIRDAGFNGVKAEDISENIMPSLERLRNFLILPYYLFVKPFGLQEKFPNASAAVEFYKMAKKGLIHYVIFTATK